MPRKPREDPYSFDGVTDGAYVLHRTTHDRIDILQLCGDRWVPLRSVTARQLGAQDRSLEKADVTRALRVLAERIT